LWPLNVEEKVMTKFIRVARNVEVWIFGAFGGLILMACLGKPAERTERARPASPVSAVSEVELAQPGPQAGTEARYVVYVVGKRPSAAEKRAARGGAG
jgi:hypothetical protein